MSRVKMMTVTLDDCDVQTFRVSGAGGQHRDKTSNGIRIVHVPSGAVGKCGEHRSQLQNKRAAFRRMGESVEFRRWVDLQHARMTGEIDAAVKEAMRPSNLLVETYDPSDTIVA